MKVSKLVLILGVFVILSFASAQELFLPRTGVSPGGVQTLSAPVLPTLSGGFLDSGSKSSVATRNGIVSGAVVSKTEAPLAARTYKFTLRNKGGSAATAMLPNGERLTLAAGETRTVEMRSSENLFKLSRSPISIQSGRKTTQVFAKTSAKSHGGEFVRWTKGQPVPDVVGVLASFVDKTMPARYDRDYAADLRSVARGNDLEKLNMVESLRISIYGNSNLQSSIKNSANEFFLSAPIFLRVISGK